MAKEHKRLGDLLIDENIITPQDLADAIAEQRRTGELLGATLVRMGLVTESQVMKTLQLQLGLPLVDLAEVAADEQALALVKEELARKYSALPLEIEGRKTLVIAMSDPLNVAALEDLRFHSNMFIKPVLALATQIQDAIERYYHIDTSMNEVINNIISNEDELVVAAIQEEESQQHAEALDELMREAEGRPIVRLTNWLLHRAVEERASDIHIEPQEKELFVRLRVDGLLHAVQRLPKWTQGAVVSRIKVLANLDIAEKRQPQDGRLMAEIRGRRVDMRVSTLPTTHGEKVVIRIIDQLRAHVDIHEVGLLEDDLGHLRRFLDRPQGIVLVTGPTGSGKSTLLYACLRHIQHESKNIVTVEDPVEYQLTGINQVQIDEKAKKTFPVALRAILRQDPDVIMIGEIRDKETAQIAFRASVTGHLVLSTTHTNDAASAVTRLIDLGLEPFMVASSLVSVVSMRLVRTLCPRCRETYEVNASNLNRLGARDLGEGSVTQNAPDSAIRQAAVENGMRTIGEDGLKKVMAGRTTLDEITRVVYLAETGVKICPGCDEVLPKEYEYCPSCGDYVGDHCEACKRRLDRRWTFCPFCGESTGMADAELTVENGGVAGAPRRGRRKVPLRRVG
jgi:type IV pilus assembly protein PilB